MGKKSKKINTIHFKKIKSMSDRIQSINVAKDKLKSLGLSSEIDGIATFYKICEEYIDTGESKSGKIELIGFKRILEYILPTNYSTNVSVLLKYNSNV